MKIAPATSGTNSTYTFCMNSYVEYVFMFSFLFFICIVGLMFFNAQNPFLPHNFGKNQGLMIVACTQPMGTG